MMRQSFVAALLLLQALAPAFASDQYVIETDDSETTAAAAAAAIPETNLNYGTPNQWTPYQTGWELVNDALAELRKIKPVQRKSKKQTGLFTIAWQIASKALPSLRATNPFQDSHQATLSAPLLQSVKLLEQSAALNNTDALYLLADFNFFGNYSHPRDFSTAFRYYDTLASLNGNSSAQHMVGLMYATGLGDAVERDQAKALLYHTFAANSGHTRSEMTVGARYKNGIGVPKSCETASKYYKRVADKAIAWYRSGPPGGMAIPAQAHRLSDDSGGVYGEGASFISSGMNAVKASPSSDAYADIDDIIEYLDLMSQKGDFTASYNIGRLYYEGQRGLEKNVELARRYFQTVAAKYWRPKDGRVVDQPKPGIEKYASKAAGFIGRMWLRGEGVKQDFKTAQRWFDRGVKSGGDAQSQWGLGFMNLHGLGVPKNVPRAIDYLRAAADQEFNLARVALGALHLDQGTPEDLKAANQYFEAARWGNIEAQYYLAELMHHGVGVDRTCEVSLAYYKNVAEKAEPLVSSWAEANQAFDHGDIELALIDYTMAAEQGYEKAQNNVAFILDPTQSRIPLPSWLKNKSPPSSRLLQNPALALVYWTRSAIQNNIDSLVKMGDYYLNGIGTEVALEKAAQCYGGASEHFQSAQALYNLGWMHENGVGLTQDFHLAKRYYDHALETNEEAYLPVTLSLLKLRVRSAWNTLTHGRINSIQDEPESKKEWTFSEWLANFLEDDLSMYYDDGSDYDAYYDDEGNQHMVGSDGEPMDGGVGGEYYDEDDDVVASLVILGLSLAIGLLMWYRARRQEAHRIAEQEERRRQQQQGQQQGANMPRAPSPRAVARAARERLQNQAQAVRERLDHQFPRGPADPNNNFAPWGPGGVGH